QLRLPAALGITAPAFLIIGAGVVFHHANTTRHQLSRRHLVYVLASQASAQTRTPCLPSVLRRLGAPSSSQAEHRAEDWHGPLAVRRKKPGLIVLTMEPSF